MKQLRIGLIGLGGMINAHIDQMNKVGGMQITAVCDSDRSRVDTWLERLGLPQGQGFTDYHELIDSGSVDAVVAATPNDAHYGIVKACLEAGMPLMAEKPFTRLFEEAYQLMSIAKQRNANCFVGFSYRYVPSFRMAKSWIESGKIGTVRHVFVQYLQDWGAPLFGTPMNWRWDTAISGTGVLHDLASHMIDAVRFLVAEPEEVSGLLSALIKERPAANGNGTVEVDIDDFAAFTARLEGDIPAVFQTSRNAFGSGNQLEVVIYGDTGALQIGCEYGKELHWSHLDEATGAKTKEVLQVPESYSLIQMQDFANYVRGAATADTPKLIDGYRNQLVMEAVVRSSQTGRAIKMNDIEREYEENKY